MKHCKRYNVPLIHFHNVTIKKGTRNCALLYTNELHVNNYLNIAKTKSNERGAGLAKCACPVIDHVTSVTGREQTNKQPGFTIPLERQAVRSLGPLRCACYQTSTRGLSTSSSRWDLNCLQQTVGRLFLNAASRLDAFSAYPFWT
jgi:hypothetical protein